MEPYGQDETDAQDAAFGREPLPAGHPLAWGTLVRGTILEGLGWPGWAAGSSGTLQQPITVGVTR